MHVAQKQKVAPQPLKAPHGSRGPLSRMRRFKLWLDRLAENNAVVTSLHVLMLLLMFTNIGLIIRWWEMRYPKPPLGILRGELLKDYDRYSPDDNYTETVLSQVFGADAKPTKECTTPACKRLKKMMSKAFESSGPAPSACEDFYRHVCRSRKPFYKHASQDLMVAVVNRVLRNVKSRDELSENSDHVRMLQLCVDGDSKASDFAFGCDFSKINGTSSQACPTDYPLIAQILSDNVLKGNPDLTAEEFVADLKRSVEDLGISSPLQDKRDHTPKGISVDMKEAVCRWLADSARCHLSGRFHVYGDVITQYQQLWNELFFAPLSEAQENSVLWDIFDGGKDARMKACAHIHEKLFRVQSLQEATAVLDKIMGGHRGENRASLGQRTAHAKHEEDELLRYQVKRRPAYLAELQAVDAELAGVSEPSASDLGTSVFSWKVRYDQARNMLTVPHGLMAVMVKSDVEEPVLAGPVSAPLMHLLLPRPKGPYSWKEGHDQHLAYVKECFRSAHNASLDVDGDSALLEELVYDSALLGPLFDEYRRTIFETFDGDVYLHPDYDNWQLFYVIWTMTHCGEPQRADLVNAVLRNSVRFTRSFNCGLMHAMYQRRKCNFWVYW
ncbi:hypothetical protein MRX96_055397 [Rhipicephalus microplus]